MDGEHVYRATRVMSVGTALSRVTGLVRVAAMTYALGVTGTRLADTYNLANTTPNIIYELFLGGLFTAVFVRIFAELRQLQPGSEWPLVSVSLTALALLSAVAAVAAPLIMHIYTFRIPDPVVRQAQHELATFLLRWFSPQIFFYGMGAIADALLNTKRRFGPAMFAPVVNNLIVAAMFIAFATVLGEQGLDLSFRAKLLLGAGTTMGVVVQALVLLPFLRDERWRFQIKLVDPAVARVVRLSAYVVAYTVINQIGVWVVLALANAVRGGVTAYTIAFMFFQLPYGLFAVSLNKVLLVDLSEAAASGDWPTFRSSLNTGIRTVSYLMVSAAVGYILLAPPLTRIILARGAAGVDDAAAVAVVLQAFALGLPFFAAFQLFRTCFNSFPDTRTPTLVNMVAVSVNIALNFPLFALLGVRGLALGHSLSYVVGSLLLLWALRRRVGRLGLEGVGATLVKVTAAASGMGVTVWALARMLAGNDLVTLAICVPSGVLVYLVLSRLLAIPERRILTMPWRRK